MASTDAASGGAGGCVGRTAAGAAGADADGEEAAGGGVWPDAAAETADIAQTRAALAHADRIRTAFFMNPPGGRSYPRASPLGIIGTRSARTRSPSPNGSLTPRRFLRRCH